TFDGELDPADPHNASITDIDLAPRAGGKVRYTSTFMILRPVNLAGGNRRLFYDFGNRGNKRILEWLNDGKESNDPTSAAEFGNASLRRAGNSLPWNGGGGAVPPAPTCSASRSGPPRGPTARRSPGRFLPSSPPTVPPPRVCPCLIRRARPRPP